MGLLCYEAYESLARCQTIYFHQKEVIMYFRALETRHTVAFHPFMVKLPLTQARLAIKFTKNVTQHITLWINAKLCHLFFKVMIIYLRTFEGTIFVKILFGAKLETINFGA